MNIGVILVNYNTRDLLRRSLASVFASAAAGGLPPPQVVVVDNASQDGSAAMVAECFPQVRLVASPQNLGYTRGNNLGLRLLGFDVATEAPAPPEPTSTPPAANWRPVRRGSAEAGPFANPPNRHRSRPERPT